MKKRKDKRMAQAQTEKVAAQFIFPRIRSAGLPAYEEQVVDKHCPRTDFVLTVKRKGD